MWPAWIGYTYTYFVVLIRLIKDIWQQENQVPTTKHWYCVLNVHGEQEIMNSPCMVITKYWSRPTSLPNAWKSQVAVNVRESANLVLTVFVCAELNEIAVVCMLHFHNLWQMPSLQGDMRMTPFLRLDQHTQIWNGNTVLCPGVSLILKAYTHMCTRTLLECSNVQGQRSSEWKMYGAQLAFNTPSAVLCPPPFPNNSKSKGNKWTYGVRRHSDHWSGTALHWLNDLFHLSFCSHCCAIIAANYMGCQIMPASNCTFFFGTWFNF